MLDRNIAMLKAREIMLEAKSHDRREPGWAYRHGLRTANLALWLRNRIFPERTEYDDILYVAGLFHDCAKDDERDHGEAGAERAAEYLRGIVAADDMPIVTHAIFNHNKRGTESTDLEKILQDADIIDHFGTIEVWLNVSYSVLGGEGPERSLEFYNTDWAAMVVELRGLLNFELSKTIYNDRIAYNEEFIRRLKIESTGGVVE
jgi:uncharacterized protein